MSRQKEELLALWSEVSACQKCDISKFARNKVFGDGYTNADTMLVGEGPGMDEDERGYVFVSKAGGILSACLIDSDLDRKNLFISNILKCHAPKRVFPVSGNRAPTREEMKNCRPFLMRQIAIIRPKIIVALGKTAITGLLDLDKPPEHFKKEWFGTQATLKTDNGDIPIVCTLHPQYLGYNSTDVRLRQEYVDIFKKVKKWTRSI